MISKPARPEIAQIKFTKGDPTLGMTNLTDDTSADTSADHMQNRLHSKDYMTCVHQNGHNFGYIPLNDLHVYKGPVIQWKSLPDIWQANKLICESKVPGWFGGCSPFYHIFCSILHIIHFWNNYLLYIVTYNLTYNLGRIRPHFDLYLVIQGHSFSLYYTVSCAGILFHLVQLFQILILIYLLTGRL